jgi:hypothetical protein
MLQYYLNVYDKFMFINLLKNISKDILKRILILFFVIAILKKNISSYNMQLNWNCLTAWIIVTKSQIECHIGPIFPNERNFDLDKSRQKFHHSLKEHHKISNIPKFRCEML